MYIRIVGRFPGGEIKNVMNIYVILILSHLGAYLIKANRF